MALNLEAGVEPVAGYPLVRPLGGAGSARSGRRSRPGGVRVALKFIRLDTDQAGPEQRALEVIRNIRHPHLLDVQFAVRVEDCLVIAMPLCDQSLLDRLRACRRRGPGLPRDELLGYMDELAEAVDFLNEPRHPAGDGGLVGIQHRDIKPHNVFLVGGSARLADFGLAKVLEASTRPATPGACRPHYVAPEVIEGRVSRRTDQYSLAVTYFQLRTGRLPFKGDPSASPRQAISTGPRTSPACPRRSVPWSPARWRSGPRIAGPLPGLRDRPGRGSPRRRGGRRASTRRNPPSPGRQSSGRETALPCETLIASGFLRRSFGDGRKGHRRPQRPLDRRSPMAGNARRPGWDRSPPMPRSIPRRGKRAAWAGLGLAVVGLAGMLLMARPESKKDARSRPRLVEVERIPAKCRHF